MKRTLLLTALSLCAAFAQGQTNWTDWSYGRPGVRVVTNAPSEAEASAAFTNEAALRRAGDAAGTNLVIAATNALDKAIALHYVGLEAYAIAMSVIEGGTNDWNRAFSWGDWHASVESNRLAIVALQTNSTMDHAVLTTNLGWSASGHYGTPARLAGFFEGGMAGYSYLGAGLYFGGSDELCVSNPIIEGAALGATAVQTEADALALAAFATNRVTIVWLSSNVWMEGDSVGTNWNVWGITLQNNTNILVISGAGTVDVNGDYLRTGNIGYGERWYTNANGCSISVEDTAILSFYSGWPAVGYYLSSNAVPPFSFTITVPDAEAPAPSSAWGVTVSTNFLFRLASTSNVLDQITAYMATQAAKDVMTNAAAFFWFYERAGWTPINHTEPLLTPDPHPMYLSTGAVANASVSALRVSSPSGSNWVEVANDGIAYRYTVTNIVVEPSTNIFLSSDFKTRFDDYPPPQAPCTNVFPWLQVVEEGTWSALYDGEFYVYVVFSNTLNGMCVWQGECSPPLTNGTTAYSTTEDFGTATVLLVTGSSTVVTTVQALATEAFVTNRLAGATNGVPAALAAYVLSNSVAQLVIYTNVSGVATSWWQVASGATNSGAFAQAVDGVVTNNTITSVSLGGITLFQGTNGVAAILFPDGTSQTTGELNGTNCVIWCKDTTNSYMRLW